MCTSYQLGIYNTFRVLELIVTGPVKIDHLSAKELSIFSFLLYHNFITIYTTTTKSSSLLQNLMGFLW